MRDTWLGLLNPICCSRSALGTPSREASGTDSILSSGLPMAKAYTTHMSHVCGIVVLWSFVHVDCTCTAQSARLCRTSICTRGQDTMCCAALYAHFVHALHTSASSMITKNYKSRPYMAASHHTKLSSHVCPAWLQTSADAQNKGLQSLENGVKQSRVATMQHTQSSRLAVHRANQEGTHGKDTSRWNIRLSGPAVAQEQGWNPP